MTRKKVSRGIGGFNDRERRAICRFLDRMIDISDSTLSSWLTLPDTAMTKQIQNQISYHRNCNSAFRWAKSIIKPQVKDDKTTIPKPVHTARADNQ